MTRDTDTTKEANDDSSRVRASMLESRCIRGSSRASTLYSVLADDSCDPQADADDITKDIARASQLWNSAPATSGRRRSLSGRDGSKVRFSGDNLLPPKKFAWVDEGARGVFPGPSIPLFQTEVPDHLTDVDISRNKISDIDAGTLLLRLPRLRRLLLAENQLTSLACVVALGVLPNLEELDIRGNPCSPDPVSAPRRIQLLTTLLAPEISHIPRVVSAAEAAMATSALVPVASERRAVDQTLSQVSPPPVSEQASVKNGAMTLSPPGRKPAMRMMSSSSMPALLTPLKSQSPVQARSYRSQHMQGAASVTSAEELARSHVIDLRSGTCRQQVVPTLRSSLRLDSCSEQFDSKSNFEPRHEQDIRRPVKGCFPRAHLYHAVVGSCYEEGRFGGEQDGPSWGAGTRDWFPKLLVFNGVMVTVRDLEDVAKHADELIGSPYATDAANDADLQMKKKTSVLNLHMKKGESYHQFLLRYRTAFVKYHRRQSAPRPRHFSDDYECWRQRQQTKQSSSLTDDEEHYELQRLPEGKSTTVAGKILPSPANTASTREPPSSLTPFTEAESLLDSFENVDSPNATFRTDNLDIAAEEKVFQAMEVDMWELQRQTLQHLEQGGFIDDGFDNISNVDDYEVPKWLTQLQYTTEKCRPKSASQSRSMKSSYDFMQDHVPCRSLTTKQQGKRLSRTYATTSAVKLSSAVSEVMKGNVSVEPETSSGTQTVDQLASPDDGLVCQGPRAKGLARLRSLGLPPSSGDAAGQDRAREQWLRQLAEDFPDKFNRATSAGETRPPAKWHSPEESVKDAILSSRLFVLDLHGDPKEEQDWHLRQVWLSPAGHIWLNAPDGNTRKASGRPTLYLGGHCVTDAQLFQAGQNETVARINGLSVYGMRVDFPGARFTRKKYFATYDAETRDDWLRVCSSIVPAKQA